MRTSVIHSFVEYQRSGRAGLYGQLARIGKVVVHPKRIELLGDPSWSWVTVRSQCRPSPRVERNA